MKKDRLYLVVILLAILGYVAWSMPHFYPFPETTAFVISEMMNEFDYNVVNYKHHIIANGFDPVTVSSECSGIIIMIAFVLTIQLMPMLTIFQKFTAILLVPVIYAGNIMRIFMSMIAGIKGNVDAMMFIHDTVGQIFLFFWAVAVYVVWLKMHSLFPRDIFANKMHGKWHEKTK